MFSNCWRTDCKHFVEHHSTQLASQSTTVCCLSGLFIDGSNVISFEYNVQDSYMVDVILISETHYV